MELSFSTWGNERKEAILLVHGLDNNLHVWDSIAKKLSRGNYVVAVDIRGNGDSQWCEINRYTVEHIVDDLKQLVNVLKLETVILAGHSLGGKVCLYFNKENPTIVSKIILLDSAPELNSKVSQYMRDSLFEERQYYYSEDTYFDELKETYVLAEEALLKKFCHNNLIAAEGRFKKKADPKFKAKMLEKDGFLSTTDLWHFLPEVSQPTLIVRGSFSSVLCNDIATKMQKTLPNCTLHTLNKASHAVMMDQPAELFHIMNHFVLNS